MLNLFQPLPSQAIFSRDPCPLALGSKRALPPLPFFPGRVEAFLFLSFFFSARDTSMPRSKCRWWDHSSSYENASLPPAVAGITLPRFARLVPTRKDRDTRVHPDLVRYSNVSCFYSGLADGDFREVDELVTWKASYEKRWEARYFLVSEVVDSSLIIFCRFEKEDEASVPRALISKLCIFVILPVRRWRFTSYQEYRA